MEATAVGGLPRGAVSLLESARTGLASHQLFFDRMKLRRPESPVHEHGRRGRPRQPAPGPVGRPPSIGIQLKLFEARRDFTRFDECRHANPANPWLVWGRYLAYRRGEARGWRRGVRLAVQRGLVIVLSQHTEGDTVRYSEIFPALRALGISVERVAEVLDEMGSWSMTGARRLRIGCGANSVVLARGSAVRSRRGNGRCMTAGRACVPVTKGRCGTT